MQVFGTFIFNKPLERKDAKFINSKKKKKTVTKVKALLDLTLTYEAFSSILKSLLDLARSFFLIPLLFVCFFFCFQFVSSGACQDF